METSTPSVSLPTSCDWCPRACGADRAHGGIGLCGAGADLRVARAALHHWEEPCISGSAGSGTIFFSNCPLRCVYCQNAPIAVGDAGAAVSVERVAQMCLELQDQGALNINFVTPTHYAAHARAAVAIARKQGLNLPIVWNTSGYETANAIDALAGTVDVYLTDFKYSDPALAQAYSHAFDYPQVAMEALGRMVSQVGEASYIEGTDGCPQMVRGVIVRHLLLPGHLDDSLETVRRVFGRFGNTVRFSLMNQYTPVISADSPVAARFPELLGRASDEDYETLLDFADALGIEDYFWQEGPASEDSFIPPFDLTGVFSSARG